jgi:hypothetical protein
MEKKIIFSVILFFGLLIFGAATAQAASLYLSPAAGSYAISQNFTLNVYVSSADNAMNAVSGTVSFPKDKLEAVSLSKSNSIINLWVQEPGFSNSAGNFNFEGVVLNPGFIGNQGKIISINFKVKGNGTAPVIFSAGSVLANDGLGTNILKDLNNANFVLGPAAPETTTPAESAGTPAAPKISSPTHPDPEKWYANANPKFVWTVPANTVSNRLLYDRNFSSQPKILYESAIADKQLENISDGVWYFHLQLRNTGGWGEISHFRFQIDTEKPDYFRLKEIERPDPTEPRAKFSLEANDKTSGIDHYEIQIDDQPIESWEKTEIYQTSVQNPGKHILIVKAVDKAGNFLADSAEFEIKPLEPPRIIDYPQKLTEGDTLIIKGMIIYPSAAVRMFLQSAENTNIETQDIQSDEKGNFTIVWGNKIKNGIYKFWLKTVDQRGAQSEPTDKYTVAVELPTILRLGNIAVNYLGVIMALILIIIGISAILIYLWRRFFVWRRRLGKETSDIEKVLRRSFEILHEKIEDTVAELDGQPGLSEREKKISDELKTALKNSEKIISREVKDLKNLTKK